MPVSRADLTAATLNGKIYLFGGYDQAAGDSRAEVYEFNPANNIYTQKASMPTPRWGPIAVAVNGKIYVFAGGNAGNPARVNEMYDPATNTWTSKANVPSNIGFQGITGCSDGSKIYLFYNGLGYAYDPQTDTYLPIPNPPQSALSWASCAYSNGKIYLLGGFYDRVGRTYNQIYDISSATWSSGAPLLFGVFGAVRENPIIGDTIYIIEGQRATNEFSASIK